jgi:hypothetical protein
MNRRCKICSSSLRDEVEQLVLEGHTFKYCQEHCEAKGLLIGEASIRRHCERHMEGYEKRNLLDESTMQKPFNIRIEDPNVVDVEAIKKELNIDSNCLSNVAKVLLGKVLLNQMYLVFANQVSYMQGLSRYPKEQIQGLNLIVDLMNKIEPSTVDLSNKLEGYMAIKINEIDDET